MRGLGALKAKRNSGGDYVLGTAWAGVLLCQVGLTAPSVGTDGWVCLCQSCSFHKAVQQQGPWLLIEG